MVTEAPSGAGDPYAEAVAAGLRDALLCGMTTVDPATGDWRRDWHPRSRRAAFVGVVDQIEPGEASLLVLFRAGPRWHVVYGWRAVLWVDEASRAATVATHPDPVTLVGELALDVMEGLDGGGWTLRDAAGHGPWGPGSPTSVVWVER